MSGIFQIRFGLLKCRKAFVLILGTPDDMKVDQSPVIDVVNFSFSNAGGWLLFINIGRSSEETVSPGNGVEVLPLSARTVEKWSDRMVKERPRCEMVAFSGRASRRREERVRLRQQWLGSTNLKSYT